MENNIDQIYIEGPFWNAEARIVQVESLPVSEPVILLAENFNTYDSNQQVFNWRETGINYSLEENGSRFKTTQNDGRKVYGATSSSNNIHTHYNSFRSNEWTNYTYRASVLLANAQIAKIGLTFFSQYRDGGEDTYYRIGNEGVDGQFVLIKRTNNTNEVLATTTIAPSSNQRYQFLIETEAISDATSIRIKIWEEGTDEPSNYEIEITDTADNKLSQGTVGIWATGGSSKYVDDVQVIGIGRLDYQAFYNLFIDHPAFIPPPPGIVALPGTMVAICDVSKVNVSLFDANESTLSWVRDENDQSGRGLSLTELKNEIVTGRLSLFILRSKSLESDSLPSFYCLNGYVNLDLLLPQEAPANICANPDFTDNGPLNANTALYCILNLLAPEGARISQGKENLPGQIHVHSSGLGILGDAVLPWMNPNDRFTAPFQLYRLYPTTSQVQYYLKLDIVRFTRAEESQWVKAWQQLSVYVNPSFPQNPLSLITNAGDLGDIPTWLTLELSDIFSVPKIFWEYTVNGASTFAPIITSFEKGAFKMYLSDQQLYDDDNVPTTVAQLIPKRIQIMPSSKAEQVNALVITFDAGEQPLSNTAQVNYSANYDPSQTWHEEINGQGLQLAYDAVDVPRQLRLFQGIPSPEWAKRTLVDEGGETMKLSEPIDPYLLWGFMPLEEGWAQIPICNLTEQIYLDAGQAIDITEQSEVQDAQFKGAITFSNRVSNDNSNVQVEQNWDLTIINTQYFEATFTLDLTPQGTFQASSIALVLSAPKVILNGFFWMSNTSPSVENALPDVDNWVNGLIPFSLSTLQDESVLFPSALYFLFPQLSISPSQPEPTAPVSAHLRSFEMQYLANEEILSNFIEEQVLPANPLTSHLPILWLRDPRLPFIQVLPLTQSSNPANTPSNSRQLAPYNFPAVLNQDTLYLPDNWLFGTSGQNGSDAWLSVIGNLIPAKEWQVLSDLPMASLSMPGLTFSPNNGLEIVDNIRNNRQLLWQFRLDLPYLDEPNALAQLPREPQSPQETSPLPDDPAPEPPKPLTRYDFSKYWKELSNLTNLAALDAVDIFTQDEDKILALNLVEPLNWPVDVQYDWSVYPGKIIIKNLADDVSITLHKNTALKGISGQFNINDTNELQLINPEESAAVNSDANPLVLVAHSLATWRDHQTSAYWDQRGLKRYETLVTSNANGPLFLQSKVGLENATHEHNLTTLLAPLPLEVPGEGKFWQIWFKNLPLAVLENNTERFNRQDTRSVSSIDKDINDPEGISREHNYLQAYEWRLNKQETIPQGQQYFELFDLHYYPLTIEEVIYKEGVVSELKMTGRLQLPLSDLKEQDSLGNVVELLFIHDFDTQRLTLKEITPLSEIEWPLAIFTGAAGEVPRLCWSQIEIIENQGGATLRVQSPILKLLLFDQEWLISMSNLEINNGLATRTFANSGNAIGIFPNEIDLSLDLSTIPQAGETTPSYQHNIQFSFVVTLGQEERPVFDAEIRMNVLGFPDLPLVSLESGQIFKAMQIVNTAQEDGHTLINYTDLAFQFRWDQLDLNEGYQFLPGLQLNAISENANTGFAVVAFTLAPPENGIPGFLIQSAFVEALFSSRWSSFLQESLLQPTPEQAFDASAGELTIGYTTEYRDFTNNNASQEWRDAIVLNGFIEVKNLISWPSDLNFDEEALLLRFPNIEDQEDFSHLRHSMRVLLNQHQFPPSLLELIRWTGGPEKKLIFTLKPELSWQFLAVTEHQIIELNTQNILENLDASHSLPPLQFRWTALQEIRWIPPAKYIDFLRYVNRKAPGSNGEVEIINPDPIDPNNPPEKITLKGKVVNFFGEGVPDVDVRLFSGAGDSPIIFPAGEKITDENGCFAFNDLPTSILSNSVPILFRLEQGSDTLLDQNSSPDWTLDIGEGEILLRINITPPIFDLFPDPFAEQFMEALEQLDDLKEVLIVEASTVHWVNNIPTTSKGFTQLQLLPNGLQAAILSDIAEFSPSDPLAPAWQLLRAPFIGRLQPNKNSYIDPQNIPIDNLSIYYDPLVVLYGYQQQNLGAAPDLLMALSSWPTTQDLSLMVSPADSPVLNKWMELDRHAVEENWIRLLNSSNLENPEQEILISISATIPQSTARLSWAPTLTNAFQSIKKQYPPQFQFEGSLPDYGRTGAIIWRERSLLSQNITSISDPSTGILLNWTLAGLNFQQFLSIEQVISNEASFNRFAAATHLPIPFPEDGLTSFIGSPYLGLGFQKGDAEYNLKVSSSELLCLDRSNGTLRPIASKLWEIDSNISQISSSNYLLLIEEWAKETHALFCPESPVLIVRLRNIVRQAIPTEGNAPALTLYDFHWFSPTPKDQVIQKVFNLRTAIDDIRLRESHYAGTQLPQHIIPNADQSVDLNNTLSYFELAPPQIEGVQPLHLTTDSTEEAVNELASGWPWGLSAIQLNTTYTNNKVAAIGPQHRNIEEDTTIKLWWQGVQQNVQFRSSEGDRPQAGLPAKFRAKPISFLLPSVSHLPLPIDSIKAAFIPENLDEEGISRVWQSILPGALKVSILGSRAGAPIVYRHQLLNQIIRQGLVAPGVQDIVSDVWISSSIPVQHRFPRPVFLPENRSGFENIALQTWASHFLPSQELYALRHPIDEAYFAPCGSQPDQGLTITIDSPAQGAVDSNWDGTIILKMDSYPDPTSTNGILNWDIIPFIEVEGKSVTWDHDSSNNNISSPNYVFNLGGDENRTKQLHTIINSQFPGSLIYLKIRVRHNSDTSGYYQELSYPLRVTSPQVVPLPLIPYFIHFEDPEYNRQLASSSGNATRSILIEDELIEIRLSSDRKVYNPDSQIAFRFDWTPAIDLENLVDGYEIEFFRKDQQSGNRVSFFKLSEHIGSNQILPGKLFEVPLPTYVTTPPLIQGDFVIIELTVILPAPQDSGITDIREKVELSLDITTEPVIPVPEAAYALLRTQTIEQEQIVDCPLFAFSPNANRIELVCPDDLTSEIVRRRAVFQWRDTLRPNRAEYYGLQKIARRGDTHFPDLFPHT